jgi:hypothetical protein
MSGKIDSTNFVAGDIPHEPIGGPPPFRDSQDARKPTSKAVAAVPPPHKSNVSRPKPFGSNYPGAHVPLEPSALESGRLVLRAAMEYGFVGPLDIPADHFHPDLKSSAIVIRNARDEGANDFADTILHLIQTTPPGEPQDLARAKVADIGDCVPHRPEALVGSAAIVREYYLVKARVMAGWKLQRTLEAGDDPTEVLREIQSLVDSTQSGSLASQLADRAFDAAIVPDKPVPILRVNGKDVLSEGNLLNVQAQLKAGKTAVIGAMIAAIFPAARLGADTLGFSAENTEGLAVIHFDTEQSRFDHDSLIRRSLARAGLKEPPDWFYSYSITDLDDGVRLDAFLLAIANAAEAHGGVFAIILDGIADICMDPNDPPESFALVRKLQTTAINYSCGIITVLHENPGSDIGKTRGHLGSQLARKAETNLRLATRTCVPKSLNAGARRTSNRFGRIAPFRSIASLPTMTTRSGRTSCSTASSMGVGLCGSKISSAASLMPCSSSVAPAASQSSINCCVAAVRPIRNARSST